jgi:hypothetical protein
MSLDPASQRSAGAFAALNFELNDLPVDVFEVGGGGLTVESLTGGHGMNETGGSSCGGCPNPPFICICSCGQEK